MRRCSVSTPCRIWNAVMGAELERLHEIRRGKGGVDEERELRFVRDRRDRRDVEHVQAGVAERFAKDEPGVFLDGFPEILGLARGHERRVDTEALERVAEQ